MRVRSSHSYPSLRAGSMRSPTSFSRSQSTTGVLFRPAAPLDRDSDPYALWVNTLKPVATEEDIIALIKKALRGYGCVETTVQLPRSGRGLALLTLPLSTFPVHSVQIYRVIRHKTIAQRAMASRPCFLLLICREFPQSSIKPRSRSSLTVMELRVSLVRQAHFQRVRQPIPRV